MKRLIHFICLVIFVKYGGACSVAGHFPGTTIVVPVEDVFRGTFHERETTNVIGISSVTTVGNTNYVNVTYEDSMFKISTTEMFEQYEEIETISNFGVTVNYNCGGGQTGTVVFSIFVIDTNNNDPIFLYNPNENKYEFTVTPPLPQNFAITGCLNEIMVRDIDLTTSRIEFEIIDGNEYFQIDYNGNPATKQFAAKIETKVFIRNLPQPMTLRISATDVDNTGDPPRTVYTTVDIISNEPFLPDDLIFSETYYNGVYSDSHEIILDQQISLIQGFDDEVIFLLESGYDEYLDLSTNGNDVSLVVKQPLPANVIQNENQILLVIRAQRELAADTTATIILQLPEETPLQFEQAYYEGRIENNQLSLPALVFKQGYQGETITVVIENEHTAFFSYSLQENAITINMSELDQNIIDENNVLLLQVIASTSRSTAITVVSLEIIKDDNITPVFEKSLYSGNYDPVTGLNLEAIVIAQGYDNSTNVSLEGYNEWFSIIQNGAVLTLEASEIPTEVFVEQKLLFTVRATKLRTVGATTVVSIDLPVARQLSFDASSYRGILNEDQVLTHDPISLSVGYADDVNYTLSGVYEEYFTITNIQNQVSISLLNNLPNSVILENSFLSLSVNALGLHTLPATATILIEIIKDDLSTPVFNRDIYVGTYLLSNNIDIEEISLRQGFDSTVTFSFQGENSEYFDILDSGNSITLNIKSEIPEEIIFREKVMVFSIVAQKPLTVGATATINIQFPEELTTLEIMSFSQNTYVGIIEDNNLSLETIVLDSGYKENTTFGFSGGYQQHFQLSIDQNFINVTLGENVDQGVFEEEPFIVLEIEASRNGAVSITTSIVIEIKQRPKIQPLFAEPYYTGVYNEEQLQFDNVMSLTQGYDDSVEFSLDNEAVSWFELVKNEESVTLALNEIPADILANNDYLLFSIIASKPGFEPANAAIVIDLPKEVEETKILNFEQSNYVGTILESTIDLPSIVLSQGYSTEVNLSLHGDLIRFFKYESDGPSVTILFDIEIQEEFPTDVKTVVLELQATAPEHVPASSTIVLEVAREHSLDLLSFDETFYTGTFSDNEITLEKPISLETGYNEDVEFKLVGDQTYFGLTVNGNSAELVLLQPIPPAVIAANQPLVFAVSAERPNSHVALATVVISFVDEYGESNILGFEKLNYVGKLENNSVADLEPIVLSQGYSSNVAFFLFGDLSQFFKYESDGPIVTILFDTEVQEPFPADVQTVVLELQATASDHVPASSTIVLEVAREPLLDILSFEETFYTGTFSENEITLEKPISLATGYNEYVEFKLVGDQTYFGLTVNGNSAELVLLQPIPPAVIAANQPLVFAVSAERPNSHVALATVVISFVDEYGESNILGFEKLNYVGKLENNSVADLEPIVLSQGYSSNVAFFLFGDLSQFFKYESDGPIVTILFDTEVQEPFPADVQTVVLELQATASDHVPASSTIVLEVAREPLLDILSFEETFYTGTFSENEITLEKPISLATGNNEYVEFKLVGDQTYFGLTVNGNSAELVLLQPIPPAVIAANQPLVFAVSAERPNSHVALATVVISFVDEYGESNILGFEKLNYVGKLENNSVADLETIVLSQGYSSNVAFFLFGDLSRFFKYESDGPIVTILFDTEVQEPFPADVQTVVLELQATASDHVPASSTIVLEVAREPSLDILSFEETFYTGTFSENEITIEKPISLATGYNEYVEFKLVGDQTYFGLTVSGNSAELVLLQPIPPAVIAVNQPLVFAVSAERPNSHVALATVVISFIDEYVQSNILGFEKLNYVGKLENNSVADLEPIVLSQGYSSNVAFFLFGDLSRFFKYESDGPIVTILFDTEVQEPFPADVQTVVLELQATASDHVPASSTIVLEVAREPSLDILSFEETFYTGTFSENEITIEKPISLATGYNEYVEFKLVGDLSRFFKYESDGPIVTIFFDTEVQEPFPADVQTVVLELQATASDHVPASSTIVLEVAREPSLDILSFEETFYTGTFSENEITIEKPISLATGYNEYVEFKLVGDQTYFGLTVSGNSAELVLLQPIPPAVITVNQPLVFAVSAERPNSHVALATVVISFIDEYGESNILGFEKLNYVGKLENNLVADLEPIVLSQGYSSNVAFFLFGDLSRFFKYESDGPIVTILFDTEVQEPFPADVQTVVLELQATASDHVPASSTIVLEVAQEPSLDILSFEEMFYTGTFSENEITLEKPISLATGYNENVEFKLVGDQSYFGLTVNGNSAELVLLQPIPPAVIAANQPLVFAVSAERPNSIGALATIVINLVDDLSCFFRLASYGPNVTILFNTEVPEPFPADVQTVVLELRARASEHIPASSTIVLEVARDPSLAALYFEETFYTGIFSQNFITLEKPIRLAIGYNDDVEFHLVGEQIYFGLTVNGNSAELVLLHPIPPAVIAANQPLVFAVRAEHPNSYIAHATIVIYLVDELEDVLGFEKSNYLGKIDNNSVVDLEPIVLSQGYSSDVAFFLFGDLAHFFRLQSDGPNLEILFNTEVQEPFPADVQTVVLELQATASNNVPASSTIILEVAREPIDSLDPLFFEETYYTGIFSENEIILEKPIRLAIGYNEDVEFGLVADQTYFGLIVNGNSAELVLLQPIPAAVIAANQPLVFAVRAERPNSHVALATIIIHLVDEYEESNILSFEKSNYVGKFKNNAVVDIEPIVLSHGYSSNVSFFLFGDLSRFFKLETDGPNVKLMFDTDVEEPFPADVQTVVLELEAIASEYVPAISTIVLKNARELTLDVLSFEETFYTGTVSQNKITLEKPIRLATGYNDDVEFKLVGDQEYFRLNVDGNSAMLVLLQPIPPDVIAANQPLVFAVSAERPNSHVAHATIVITLVNDHHQNILSFEKLHYVGMFEYNSVVVLEPIVLTQGFSNNVEFFLFGEFSRFFKCVSDGPNVIILFKTEEQEEFPADVRAIVLKLQATAPEHVPASSTIVLNVAQAPSLDLLYFEETFYTGIFSKNEVKLEKPIRLASGYNNSVEFNLVGDQTYFGLTVNGNSAELVLLQPIPPGVIAANQPLVFAVSAERPDSHVAHATIIIYFVDEYEENNALAFEKVNYVGKLEDNSVVVLEPIVLSQGFSESVTFELTGDMSEYFTVTQGSAYPTISLQIALPDGFISDNNVVVLNLGAFSSSAAPVYATIILEIENEHINENVLSFSEIHYFGTYNATEGLVFESDIMLSQGYDENVIFALNGDDSQWFYVRQEGNLAIIEVKEQYLEELANQKHLIFVIEARNEENIAKATIIITLTSPRNVQLSFEKTNYLGIIQDDSANIEWIVLQEGYNEDVTFTLIGDLSENFRVTLESEGVSIILIEPIAEQAIPANRILIFDLMASAPERYPAHTTVIFEIIHDGNKLDFSFDKVVYTGILNNKILQHEIITLVGHNGPIEIIGGYGSMFTASISNNIVTIVPSEDISIPSDVSTLVLELRASKAGAVLVVDIVHTGVPTLPTVTFGSEIYALSVDVDHTGFLGKVAATASNLESLTYELILNTEHLQQRLSINNDGEITLSAPVNAGVYSFQIQATTVISRVSGTATAHLTVSAITVCENNDKAVPPLIVIDRDEESTHQSLVPLNTEEFPGCQYIMSSRWPFEQSWLYVDENGLHTTAIDREHPSIAFMALSQIQVELILQCNDDPNSRHKRSIELDSRNDWLGPYDYGTNKWILTNTIHFNARRSFVNLIVNDINDNAPIFVGKENEPIAVGYPIASLEGTILPRSLAELEATDADIGENANIRYWSAESVLAVAPTTGFVHVRVGEQLENDMRLIVQATDRFGEGLTGTIELIVKLVDSRHIAVVTVRDAFLDDEKTILEDLSTSVGYEVKALRSVITSDETQSDGSLDEDTRVKRETTDTGSSLVLFIYGLIEREPITVEQLTTNIREISSGINIVRTVSLEDHLTADQIIVISGRETALFVATIVLSVLLFMLIAAIVFWLFLNWRRNRKYNEFTDEGSTTSDQDSTIEQAKPGPTKPKLNIDELKRSERRLQQMLDAPIEKIDEKPIVSMPIETKDLVIEIPSTPISNIQTPIVIQSFDKLKQDDGSDDDEFGEIKKPDRRKSVVTFNENVEKIIHLEDDNNSTDEPEIEIYKL